MFQTLGEVFETAPVLAVLTKDVARFRSTQGADQVLKFSCITKREIQMFLALQQHPARAGGLCGAKAKITLLEDGCNAKTRWLRVKFVRQLGPQAQTVSNC
jgi:hypothetical protein